MVVLVRAVLDVGQDADGADRVLVDRVRVVHVVLRLRHDPSEIGHEAAEHAGLVEAPQRGLGIVTRRQHGHEQAIGLGVAAQPVDQADVVRDLTQGRGMDVEVVLLRHVEEPQDRRRILLEHVRRRRAEALAIQSEAVELARPQRLPQRRERRLAAMAVLERGDEDARQIADDLGVKIVVLHEALDAAAGGAVLIAEARRDFPLQIERQAVVGAAGEIVDVAAHGRQKTLGALEVTRFARGQHALGNQLGRFRDPIEIARDPEQQVQVAQATLALLDVGFDDVARIAHPLVALVALDELGLDEVAPVAGQEFLGEGLDQLVEQRTVAPDVALLEQRRADRLVALGVADALVDRAGGVADLQPHVPQQVEHELDDLFAARRLLVGTQEQQIEVAERRQLAAAEAAGRHHAQPLGGAGVGGGIGVALGEVEQHADQLVHQERGRRQHGRPVVAHLAGGILEAAADFTAADRQGFAERRQDLGTRDVARRPVLDQPGQGLLECAAPDDGAAVGNGIVRRGHARRILQGAEGLK